MFHLISLLYGLHILAKYMTVDTTWAHTNCFLVVYNLDPNMLPDDIAALKKLEWNKAPFENNWYVRDGNPFKHY